MVRVTLHFNSIQAKNFGPITPESMVSVMHKGIQIIHKILVGTVCALPKLIPNVITSFHVIPQYIDELVSVLTRLFVVEA